MCKEDKALRAKEQEVVETIFNHIAEYNSFIENGKSKQDYLDNVM